MDISNIFKQTLNLPQSLKGVEFSPEQFNNLKEGKVVLVEGMTSKKTMETDNPKKFDAYLQFNASKGSFDFNYDGLNGKRQENKQEQAQAQGDQQPGNVRIPGKLLGAELTPQQQGSLRENKTIYVEGMTDKKGQPFNAYITVNHEKGKLDFHKYNPDKAKKITPDNAGKTQVAVNTEGKTNEATKHVKEPLKQNQQRPTEKQQEQKEQRKPKPKGQRL